MKKIAEILLDMHAVKISVNPPFTWTSGIKSPVYCDNRLLISYPGEREVIIEALIETMEEKGLYPDFLAGTATAGIPWASFLADRLNLPMVFVREKPKAHGTQKQIEGDLPPGSTVLIIEDLISTGKSSLVVADAIEKEGKSTVLGVLALMSWELPVAEVAFRAKNLALWTLTRFSELIPLASEKGYLKSSEAALVLKFKENPEQWGINLATD